MLDSCRRTLNAQFVPYYEHVGSQLVDDAMSFRHEATGKEPNAARGPSKFGDSTKLEVYLGFLSSFILVGIEKDFLS